MRAGRLRRYLGYQPPPASPAADALGQSSPAWSTAVHVWAEVRTPSGRELLLAQGQAASVTHVLRIRHPGFLPAPSGRFVDAAPLPGAPGVYEIGWSQDPDDRRRELLVYCTERADPAAVDASNL